jgi:hypothetical protein
LRQALVSKVALCADPTGLPAEQFFNDLDDDDDDTEERKQTEVIQSSLQNLLAMHVLMESKEGKGSGKRCESSSRSSVCSSFPHLSVAPADRILFPVLGEAIASELRDRERIRAARRASHGMGSAAKGKGTKRKAQDQDPDADAEEQGGSAKKRAAKKPRRS